MSLAFQKGQRAKVKKIIEQHDKYAIVHLSTSRKRTEYEKEHLELVDPEKNKFLLNDYAYSDWGFVRFLGKANTFLLENVREGDVIVINSGSETQEPYEDKDGNIIHPKNPQRVVWECELYGSEKKDNKTKTELPKEDDIPL